jgi:hypothetical protein
MPRAHQVYIGYKHQVEKRFTGPDKLKKLETFSNCFTGLKWCIAWKLAQQAEHGLSRGRKTQAVLKQRGRRMLLLGPKSEQTCQRRCGLYKISRIKILLNSTRESKTSEQPIGDRPYKETEFRID